MPKSAGASSWPPPPPPVDKQWFTPGMTWADLQWTKKPGLREASYEDTKHLLVRIWEDVDPDGAGPSFYTVSDWTVGARESDNDRWTTDVLTAICAFHTILYPEG
jgi:hypothetical protein